MYYDLNIISLNRGRSCINSPEWSILINIIGKRYIFQKKQKKDWEKFGLNNKSIALNILYVPCNNKEIRHAYKSKYNPKHENQVIFLMITDGKKWHYLAVKKSSALFKRITSKNMMENFIV